MKNLLCLAVLFFSTQSWSNSTARTICETYSSTEYPNTYKTCLSLTQDGKFDSAAVQVCKSMMAPPMDRNECVIAIKDNQYDPGALLVCTDIGRYSASDLVKCATVTRNRRYSALELSSCKKDLACLASSGSTFQPTGICTPDAKAYISNEINRAVNLIQTGRPYKAQDLLIELNQYLIEN